MLICPGAASSCLACLGSGEGVVFGVGVGGFLFGVLRAFQGVRPLFSNSLCTRWCHFEGVAGSATGALRQLSEEEALHN